MVEYSLVSLGELSKPATVFIEKVSNAIGVWWEPRQIRRVAQAKADAAMTLAESEIEITDLQRRAVSRFVEEETKKQQNIEAITEKAISLLDPTAKAERMEDDWITNFFDKCRIVSDNDMQNLWSRILAGEANNPGAFSRKTVNLLADLDKTSAKLFTNLCRFGWRMNSILCPLVLGSGEEIYNRHGIHFYALGSLNSLGLIQVGDMGVTLRRQPKTISVFYYGRSVQLTFPNNADNTLQLGEVLLTQSGRELATVIDSEPIDGFFEFVYDKWAEKSLVPPRSG